MCHKDSLITFTLDRMKEKIKTTPQAGPGHRLLFTGSLHDAIPRRLLLDTRLSPLDKMAWMMIRLYAQNNQGAVFPTYDELQLQLASPHKGKASRETVSRVLLMLRLTGWLSLCKKVRDEKGRVQGNIYAQHDEPLSFMDAQAFEPGWLDMVAQACQHPNKTIAQTAWQALTEIKADKTMRHFHSHLALLESRLASAQSPQQMAAQNQSELSQKASELRQNQTELSPLNTNSAPSSASEPRKKPSDSSRVRKPNHYVRNNINNKNTYVANSELLPAKLVKLLTPDDRQMIQAQLQALPETQRQAVLQGFETAFQQGRISNPVGWLFSVMKCARTGTLYQTPQSQNCQPSAQPEPRIPETPPEPRGPRSSADFVKHTVANIRATLQQRRQIRS